MCIRDSNPLSLSACPCYSDLRMPSAPLGFLSGPFSQKTDILHNHSYGIARRRRFRCGSCCKTCTGISPDSLVQPKDVYKRQALILRYEAAVAVSCFSPASHGPAVQGIPPATSAPPARLGEICLLVLPRTQSLLPPEVHKTFPCTHPMQPEPPPPGARRQWQARCV